MGIDTGIVLAAMDHAQAVHIAELADAANYILDRLLPGDVVLTLSAGDGNLVGKWVLDGLKKRLNEE
jgi:UDP-N-acetylmuramate-alanine ligase